MTKNDGLNFLHKNIITLAEARNNLAGGFGLSRDMQIYLLFEVQRLRADYADVHADFEWLVEKLTGKAPNNIAFKR